ncbi:MAG: ATP-binding protein [Chloroflexota bacterium]
MRTSAFQWIIGLYCAALGSLMLVAPHQFAGPAYALVEDGLPIWGSSLLTGAALMIAAIAFPTSGSFRSAAFIVSSAGLAALAISSGTAVAGVETTRYGVLALASLVCSRRPSTEGTPERDAFELTIATAAGLSASAGLLAGWEITAPAGTAIRVAIVAAAVLSVATFAINAASWVRFAAGAAVGVGLILLGLLEALPPWSWVDGLFTCGLGGSLAAFPWLGRRLWHFDGSTMRARFALSLVTATALPLIVAVALNSYPEERVVAQRALEVHQTLAATLADHALDYISLHRAAAETVAASASAKPIDPEELTSMFIHASAAYSGALRFAAITADGALIADASEGWAETLDRAALAGRALAASQTLVESAPLVAGAAPQMLIAARFTPRGDGGAAVVLARLALTGLEADFKTASAAAGRETVLVDEVGRSLIRTRGSAAPAADLSHLAPVAAILAGDTGPGSMRYTAGSVERLAGYARVPELGWGVIVDRTVPAVAYTARYRHDYSYGILLLTIIAAGFTGAIAADRLARPLAALRDAVDRLRQGDVQAPVAASSVLEVRSLATAFEAMRGKLVDLSAEVARLEARREMDRLQREFVSVASHEFRTPLASLVGFSELLRDEDANHDERRAWIRAIHEDANRLTELVEDLLDVAALEEGGQRVTLEVVDLSALITSSIQARQALATGHSFSCHIDPSANLVLADGLKLSQVIGNLISNATKYSPEGGAICITASPHGDSVRVSVSDEGLGIPTDEIPRLFERFHRIQDESREGIPGTGLGLYICGRLMKLQGGRIWAESQGRDSGSTFHLEIARAREGAGVV